jgi:hypothetical protein
MKGAKPLAGGVSICCPSHDERNASCSVRTGPDGTIQLKCHACDLAGDALTLIGAAYGLSTRTDFREILALGAELGGQLALAQEIRSGERATDRKPLPAPQPGPERDYPPFDEVSRLWLEAVRVSSDVEAWEHLRGRGIDPESVDGHGLARVVEPAAKLPQWARYGRRSWHETGHRLLVPVFAVDGQRLSVRAWRIVDGDTPKRLPPAGHRASPLVMANRGGWLMLAGRASPRELVIAEGEPDFLTAATTWDCPTLGIVSGSWTESFARRIPSRTEVHLMPHRDEAGDRYAAQVIESLGDRCPVRRLVA